MKAELEIRCGAQTPFIVSETYTIPMANPHQEHLHPPASTETTYIPQGVVHHKVNPGAYYWPTPTAYTNLAIFDQGDSDLTQQEVIEQANSFYGLTLEIAAVVESGFEVYLPSGTYDLELLYGWDHYSFETTRPNWLGDPEHFATVEYSSPLINFSTAPY
ncbi:MAG: hypothetical protein KDC71_24515 [Acidobacteria bacterium]|nr:hypothetical protein [Acidobacteriota bacterium]